MIIWLLACSSGNPIQPWPERPDEIVQRCAEEQIPELKTICNVQAAAKLAEADRAAEADKICQKMDPGTWRDECNFRIGEELGAAGNLISAVKFCSKSGRFSQNCLTHAMWRAPVIDDLNSNHKISRLESAFSEFLGAAFQNAEKNNNVFQRELERQLPAQFTYSIYLGSGVANPEPAHLTGTIGVHYRTAFAFEAARILKESGEFRMAELMRSWSEKISINGNALQMNRIKGRWKHPLIGPHEEGLTRAVIFGGSSRLVSPDPEVDMLIAGLEASFWLESTSGKMFIPWLKAKERLVRWTAAKLLAMSWMEDTQKIGSLKALIRDLNDQESKWYLQKGVKAQKVYDSSKKNNK